MVDYNNFTNSYQGKFKRVLCVCTAGLLRSPTAAWVLSNEPYNFNTRCCGVDSNYALIYINRGLLAWANEIVCMEQYHADYVYNLLDAYGFHRPVMVLDIPDNYAYRDPKLVKLIKEKYDEKQKVIGS